ncbi:hypothetical protein [Pseudoalteromonas byunsanensis]|nr:hypothetical protein [Pseudoalteromonas byunsanensis]
MTKYKDARVTRQKMNEQQKNWYRFKFTLLPVLSTVLINTVATYENEFGHTLAPFTITDFIIWFMVVNSGFFVIFSALFWYLSGKAWEENNHQ